jgi:hypothetical protein
VVVKGIKKRAMEIVSLGRLAATYVFWNKKEAGTSRITRHVAKVFSAEEVRDYG